LNGAHLTWLDFQMFKYACFLKASFHITYRER